MPRTPDRHVAGAPSSTGGQFRETPKAETTGALLERAHGVYLASRYQTQFGGPAEIFMAFNEAEEAHDLGATFRLDARDGVVTVVDDATARREDIAGGDTVYVGGDAFGSTKRQIAAATGAERVVTFLPEDRVDASTYRQHLEDYIEAGDTLTLQTVRVDALEREPDNEPEAFGWALLVRVEE